MVLKRSIIFDREFNNKIFLELQKVYGIGLYRSFYICNSLGLNPFEYCSNLNLYYFELLVSYGRVFYLIDSKLIIFKKRKIKILKEILSYRGLRIIGSLPVRGQRTCSNAKTRKRFNIV